MRRGWWHILATALYLFLYAPMVVVVVYSFNAAHDGFIWRGFSTAWYRTLFADPAVSLAVRNTVALAVLSTAVSTCLGTMLAVGLTRYWFPGKRLVAWLIYVPVVIPDIVMAVALFLFYSMVSRWLGLLRLGLGTMTIAHITFQIPFVTIVVRARLAGLDPALEEAAHDLGATPWQTFWRVTFPLALPGVLAGAMLAVTVSLDDFIISFFSAGAGNLTVPILIYSQVKRGVTPEINALSALIVAASIAGTIGVTCLQRARRAKDPEPQG
ncbi:MAG: ABC transporter permease [Verrucomicrobia bacterium]|nr:ABC transporter permease [Verrucomicrobiota bacterium]